MAITAALVKELREKTSAGMLDCKKALVETDGDLDKAVDWLRTKGITKASKKAGRIAAEGLVTSYIHAGGRIGVLLEINSETDFVARNESFQGFVKDIAMHIAASSPKFISMEDIPDNARDDERRILEAKNREDGKKEEIIAKITDGQMKKWASEICLLDQKFVKNPDKTIANYLQETIAHIGENIVIRRFSRYELGEGIEKKSISFADEVAEVQKG